MSESASPQCPYANSGADHSQGPPRKKMRKGTRSCIECRRRKIKCTFEPGRTHICNECFARGSTCIDQEHGDVSSFAASTSTLQQKEEQNTALKERVTYLEDLVKQVLDRLPEKQAGAPSPQKPQNANLQADTQAGTRAFADSRFAQYIDHCDSSQSTGELEESSQGSACHRRANYVSCRE